MTGRKSLKKIKEQLAIESNCSAEDFTRADNVLTLPALDERRRHFADAAFFFKMTTMGGNAVISADARLHEWLRAFISGKQGHWLFEHSNLCDIDEQLHKYNKRLWQTHHMFLPKHDAEIPAFDFPVKWFEEDQIHQFYEGKPFPNAFCEEFTPSRPDMLAIAAYDGEKIIGMAGCSADTPVLWQIGIDVDKDYRGRHIGTYLVSMIKNEILRRGKIPYYGTSLSNLHSWNIALNSGFSPAWVEVETKEW